MVPSQTRGNSFETISHKGFILNYFVQGIKNDVDGSLYSSQFASLFLSLDFLSEITGDPVYHQLNERVLQIIQKSGQKGPNGLFRNSVAMAFINGRFWSDLVQESGGNYFEYVVKAWIRSNRSNDTLKQMVIDLADYVNTNLVRVSKKEGMTYVTALVDGKPQSQMAHATCYAGGLFALTGVALNETKYLQVGKEITRTCMEAAKRSPSMTPPTLIEFDHPTQPDASPSKMADQGRPINKQY